LTTEVENQAGEAQADPTAAAPPASADVSGASAPIRTPDGELFARPPAEIEFPSDPKKSDEEELVAAAQDDLKLLAEAARFASAERVCQVIEALLFAAEKPLDLPGLMEATQFSQEQVEQGMAKLSADYAARKGGIALADLGGRWQLRTDAAVGAYVRRMLQVKPRRAGDARDHRLSPAAHAPRDGRHPRRRLRRGDQGAARAQAHPHPRQEG